MPSETAEASLNITEWNQYQRALDCALFELRGGERILQRATNRLAGNPEKKAVDASPTARHLVCIPCTSLPSPTVPTIMHHARQ
jgi:hypothetical protein